MTVNKKFILNTVIVVLVIALLVGALYVLTRPEENKEPAPANSEEQIEIFSIDPAKMRRAEVTNQYGSYSLYRENGSWRLTGFEGMTLDVNMLDALTNTFSDVTSSQLIADSAGDSDVFGLISPTAAIKISTDDASRTFLIGNETPDGNGYYFSTDAGPEVYFMESYVADVAFLTARDYVSLGASFTAEEVTEMRIEPASGGALHVVMNPDGAQDRYGLLSYWTITEPEERSASNSEVTTVLTTPASEMENSASAIYEDTAENRTEKGLASPEFRLSVTLGDKEINYLVSPADGEYRYIIREDSGYILRVDDSGCAFLHTTMEQVAENYLAIVDIAVLSGVTMTKGDNSLSFTVLDGGGDNAAFYVGDRELSADEFRGFYQQIVALLVSGVAEDAPKGEVVGSIVYRLNSGEELKLEFTPFDERNYGVYINGKRQYTMLKKNVDKVFDLMADF